LGKLSVAQFTDLVEKEISSTLKSFKKWKKFN
jgi:hypothetical protein